MDLVKSEAFRSRLAVAARLTRRTGHESGFSYIWYADHGTIHPSPVFEGQTDNMLSYEAIDWRQQTFPLGAMPIPLLDLHLHPFSDDYLGLSPSDVRRMNPYDRGIDIRPLVAVGLINEQSSGRLFLFQKDFPGYLSESGGVDEEFYDNYLKEASRWPASDIGRSIEVPGYVKADVLRFRVPPDCEYAKLLNPRVLERFGYGYGAGRTLSEPLPPEKATI